MIDIQPDNTRTANRDPYIIKMYGMSIQMIHVMLLS
jgi:hypothetical protein